MKHSFSFSIFPTDVLKVQQFCPISGPTASHEGFFVRQNLNFDAMCCGWELPWRKEKPPVKDIREKTLLESENDQVYTFDNRVYEGEINKK